MPQPRSSLRARLGALVLALAAVSAPLAATSSARAADPAPDRLAGAPKVGSCHDATKQQANRVSPKDPSFACSTRAHTLWVEGVVPIPDDVSLDPDSRALQEYVAPRCDRAHQDALGKSRTLLARTVYRRWIFLPTPAQRREGARWVSCELSLTADGGLLRNRLTAPPRLKGLPDSIAACVGTKYYQPCSRPHRYRAVYAQTVYEKPTKRAIERAIAQVCPRHVRSERYFGAVFFGRATSFEVTCFDATRR
ncbi:hypothetical protein K8Z61_14425 [Nocardioides sp. TRM66260-LWL]|uniref:septum formation family protein n=1 Tax=Nocardioides sp. TRM66260-LWL TaxID=2874478 RepID=UPI001CC3814E|nr:septum formation family protein [Nocardioides sp. TRM66260-LWL]MBZ5735687.1 hypothetical protein [Nocardioides sp. TRM66260-LWL]